MRLTQALLERNVRVYSTRMANSGIPRDLEGEGKHLNRGKTAFQMNGDVMVQVWKAKTSVNDKYNP
jgi:hypothetical protein